MGNLPLKNLTEKEKVYFTSIQKEIDLATNYKKLFTPEPPKSRSPSLNKNAVEVGNLDLVTMNAVCESLKRKISKKANKKAHEK